MTISEHLTEQTNMLNLEKLTPEQCQWLHFIRTLFTWAYISEWRRENDI